MKPYLAVLYLVAISQSVFPQEFINKEKHPIDHNTVEQWTSVGRPAISDDGKYIAYIINNSPFRSQTLVLKESFGTWERRIEHAREAQFSIDNKRVFFELGTDSLCIWKLGTEERKFIPLTKSWKVFMNEGSEYLVYQLDNGSEDLVFVDFNNKLQNKISHVKTYALSKSGNKVAYSCHPDGNNSSISANLFDLKSQINKVIWKSDSSDLSIDKFAFDRLEGMIAFSVSTSKRKKNIFAINLHHLIEDYTDNIFQDTLLTSFEGSSVGNLRFNCNGTHLFVDGFGKRANEMIKQDVKVDLWNYKDDIIQPLQLREQNQLKSFMFSINLNSKDVYIVDSSNARIIFPNGDADEWAILLKSGFWQEGYWRFPNRSQLYIVNTLSGKRQLIKSNMFYGYCSISPNGNYVIYYDDSASSLMSYNIREKKFNNISQALPTSISDHSQTMKYLLNLYSFNMYKWLPDGKRLIIYDQYDIWLVNLDASSTPRCLTKQVGRKTSTIFRITSAAKTLEYNGPILLTAFVEADKTNGFYSIDLQRDSPPEKLLLGSYLYNWPSVFPFEPVKAKKKKVWLIQRMSTVESPNYFVTRDFKTLTQVSDLQPQKKVNWMTSELHQWGGLDGKKVEGILYKPENFDEKKKYPVIFNFYEERSNELNLYLKPELCLGPINIPYFVSNGYLVFVPDITYEIGNVSEGVCNSVIAAASYLSTLPFVDTTKMGIQGHSFGGYEVNILITKTQLFKAAVEAAGAADLISRYGSVSNNGISNQWQQEIGQMRIGANIWQRLDLYIKNSPIFEMHKVETPLLIMHNKADAVVPFSQGIELFTALRRLGKKVWMLQYDYSGHQLIPNDSKDYTIRLKQYFDHYLKDLPVPNWMTRGIEKGIEGVKISYEFDLSGTCGLDCRICQNKHRLKEFYSGERRQNEDL